MSEELKELYRCALDNKVHKNDLEKVVKQYICLESSSNKYKNQEKDIFYYIIYWNILGSYHGK